MVRAALAALVTSSLALAACGGTVVFEEAGAEGTGGAGDGGAPATGSTSATTRPTTSGPTTSGPSTSGPTTSGPTTPEPNTSGPDTSSPVSTGAPGGICGTGVTLFFGQYDACLADACCVEVDDCTRQGTDVLGCQNCLDGFGGECRAALECAEGCLPSGPACSSGLEPELGPDLECLTEACCAEMMFCTSAGPRLDDCFECLGTGQGPRCEPFLECYATSCNIQGICSSGLTTGDPEADFCLSENCCDEFVACTDGGNDAQACVDCLIEGGGARCDAAIECNEAFGCDDDLDG